MAVLTISAYFFGEFLARIFSGKFSGGILGTLEQRLFRWIGTSAEHEAGWKDYARDMLTFNAIGFLVLFILLLIQGYLPLNPQGVSGFDPVTALNTAVSFVTNTNWQIYSGEIAASYLLQVAGFAVQNFLSAATGICIAIAVMRGLTRRSTGTVGNFWVDLTRVVLYVLLPLSFVFALLLVSQGVIQNFEPSVQAVGYGPAGPQTIAMGPVASQEAIKELGTNGGGFFNANSAHPFENPTAATNLIEIFLILLIPASLPFTFGSLAGNRRQGWALYAVMIVMFLVSLGALYSVEMMGNPLTGRLGASGIPMEGKEVRFGLAGTALFATATTASSCGAVNAMMDSLTPLAGMVPMLLILVGEVVFGGVGSGFYTLIAFFVIAVFIAGLMIGRSPEYLGKKIGIFEMRMAVLTVLISGVLVLVFTGIALVVPGGTASMQSQDAHGLSELVYAFGSMANNNGSAFAGFNAAPLLYALGGAIAMAIGRFVPALAMLALAGSLGKKNITPPGLGTLPTGTPTFVVWVILIVLIIGALTFFPLFATGPFVEYLKMTGA